jgi:NAD-dependent SIR2 family protein deacetylase
MHDTIQRPRCSKCEQQMAWHSDQDVHTREGYALVQVFKCETCDRLKARRVVSDESFVANA